MGKRQRPRGCGISHDQNYKNLVLDWPRAALALFAAAEPATHDAAGGSGDSW